MFTKLTQFIGKIKSFFIFSAYKVLCFLNLIDQNKNLSITNLLVIGFSIKFLFFAPTVNLGDIAVLIGTFITYGHKKHLLSKKEKSDSETKSELETLTNKIDDLTNDIAKVKLSVGASKLR